MVALEWFGSYGQMSKFVNGRTDGRTDRRTDRRCPFLRLLRRARMGVTGANYGYNGKIEGAERSEAKKNGR